MENIQLLDARSEELTADDKRTLKRLLVEKKTIKAAAQALGINRDTYSDMLKKGTCRPSTLTTVRQFEKANFRK